MKASKALTEGVRPAVTHVRTRSTCRACGRQTTRSAQVHPGEVAAAIKRRLAAEPWTCGRCGHLEDLGVQALPFGPGVL